MLSRDIVVIINYKKTKEILKKNTNELIIIIDSTQINYRYFLVIVYSMQIAAVDYSK